MDESQNWNVLSFSPSPLYIIERTFGYVLWTLINDDIENAFIFFNTYFKINDSDLTPPTLLEVVDPEAILKSWPCFQMTPSCVLRPSWLASSHSWRLRMALGWNWPSLSREILTHRYSPRKYYWCLQYAKYFWSSLDLYIFQCCDSNNRLFFNAPHLVITLPTLHRKVFTLQSFASFFVSVL